MIKKRLLFGLVFLLLNLNAWAGQEANGGVAVLCTNPTGTSKSLELYDHFEARIAYQMRLDMGGQGLTYDFKVNYVLERLFRINPTRARLYKTWFSEFFNEAEFLVGIKLIDTPDVGSGYIPRNCTLEQIAVQREPIFPRQKRYTLSYDLWKLMDEDGKAGLILHELVLRELANQTSFPHKTSTMARYLNSLISSSEMTSISLRKYLMTLKLLKVEMGDTHLGTPVVVFNGNRNSPVNLEFHDDDIVKSGEPALQDKLSESEIPTIPYTWRGMNLLLTRQTYSFLPNGRLKMLHLAADANSPITLAVGLNSLFQQTGALSIEVYPNEEIRALYYTGFENFIHPNYTGRCHEPRFYPGEIIERCHFSEPIEVRIDGRWIGLKPCNHTFEGVIDFDPLGTPKLIYKNGQPLACSAD